MVQGQNYLTYCEIQGVKKYLQALVRVVKTGFGTRSFPAVWRHFVGDTLWVVTDYCVPRAQAEQIALQKGKDVP